MSPKIGRNDICSCGSGKKYKNCCGKNGFHLSSKANQLLLGGVLLIGIIAIGILYINVGDLSAENENINNTSKQELSPPTASTKQSLKRTFTPQPQGDVPPGKVWSGEHGHWHDANPNVQAESGTSENPIYISGDESIQINPNKLSQPSPPTQKAAPKTLTPQPPGDAPPGKVWSKEHGHWHDATRPSAAYSDKPSLTPPVGPPPPGKVWSPEHGHWHGPPNASDVRAKVTTDMSKQSKAPYKTKPVIESKTKDVQPN